MKEIRGCPKKRADADHTEESMMEKRHHSYREANALGNIDAEQVFRLKKILDEQHRYSEELLVDSLRLLFYMDLPADALMATNIVSSVRNLRGNPSRRINDSVNALMEGWKAVLDDWMDDSALINAEPVDDSSPAIMEEELPWLTDFPPLDIDGISACLDADVSHIFDGVGEDENPVVTTTGKPEFRKRKPQRNVGRGKVLELCLEVYAGNAEKEGLPRHEGLPDLSRFFDGIENDGGNADSRRTIDPEISKRKLQKNVGRGKVYKFHLEAANAKERQPIKTQPKEAEEAKKKQSRHLQTKAENAKEKEPVKVQVSGAEKAKEKQQSVKIQVSGAGKAKEKHLQTKAENAKDKEPVHKIQVSGAEKAKEKQQPVMIQASGAEKAKEKQQAIKSQVSRAGKAKENQQPEKIQISSSTSYLSPTNPEKKPVEINYAEKLEISKKRLHESYSDADNAKKRRCVRILELEEIVPIKKSLGKRGCQLLRV